MARAAWMMIALCCVGLRESDANLLDTTSNLFSGARQHIQIPELYPRPRPSQPLTEPDTLPGAPGGYRPQPGSQSVQRPEPERVQTLPEHPTGYNHHIPGQQNRGEQLTEPDTLPGGPGGYRPQPGSQGVQRPEPERVQTLPEHPSGYNHHIPGQQNRGEQLTEPDTLPGAPGGYRPQPGSQGVQRPEDPSPETTNHQAAGHTGSTGEHDERQVIRVPKKGCPSGTRQVGKICRPIAR